MAALSAANHDPDKPVALVQLPVVDSGNPLLGCGHDKSSPHAITDGDKLSWSSMGSVMLDSGYIELEGSSRHKIETWAIRDYSVHPRARFPGVMNRAGGSNRWNRDKVQSPPEWIHGPRQKRKEKEKKKRA